MTLGRRTSGILAAVVFSLLVVAQILSVLHIGAWLPMLLSGLAAPLAVAACLPLDQPFTRQKTRSVRQRT